jgi:hypothetical protein
MAFDQLDATDNVAVGDDVPESEIGERFELPPDFGGGRMRRGFVKY